MRPEAEEAPLAGLAAVLREERALILRGAWAGLEALAARKAAGVEALAAGGAPEAAAGAGSLLRDLARNQALLGAAIEGFREAGRRRAGLREARAGFSTYDAGGARGPVAAPRPRVERKA